MHLLIKLVTFSTLKRAWRNHQLEIPSFDVIWKNRWCLEGIYWYFHANVNSNNNILSKSPIFDCSHSHVGKSDKNNNHQLVFFSIKKVSNKTFVMYIDRGTGVHLRHVFNKCLTMLVRCCMSRTCCTRCLSHLVAKSMKTFRILPEWVKGIFDITTFT